MTAIDFASNFEKATKTKYRNGGIEKAVLSKSPFAATCEKFMMPGKTWEHVMSVSHAGFSASFTVAQANKSSDTKISFAVTHAAGYAQGSVDGMTQQIAQNDGAVADPMFDLLEQKETEFAHGLSWSAWSGQGGAIGRIASGSTGVTVTLTNPTDHVNFNIGDYIELASDNLVSSTARVGRAQVVGIARTAGTVTTSAAWDSLITGATTNDYMFKEGCVGNTAAGVLAWVPPDASPASLFGVTRTGTTTDRDRLAGIAFDCTPYDMASAIIQGRARLRNNANVDGEDILWLNPLRRADLEMALEGKSVPTKVTGKTSTNVDIGFSAIKYGDLTIMDDPFCPNRYGLMTKKSGVWKCGTTPDGLPHFQTSGGKKLYPEPGSDADQFRMRGYFQYVCTSAQSNVLMMWEGS